MFIFAHIFLGALIGLGFWHLTDDRRALPLCIIGAVFPDLLDKSLALIIPATLVTAAFFIFAVTMAVKAQMAKPATGSEGLVSETGVARTRLDPEGKVFVHGEFWNAYADEPIEEGEKIRILKTEGLRVKVEKIK